MLRVVPSSNPNDTATFVTVDQRKKQVTLFDPTFLTSNYVTPANRRTGVTAPKMFAFDAIFGQDSTQVCIISLFVRCSGRGRGGDVKRMGEGKGGNS